MDTSITQKKSRPVPPGEADIYPRDRCIHELFERQADWRPDAAAIRFNSETLTYRQLNERANRMAQWLRQRGVGPDIPVGICLERCPDMIAALLGILKAGGAYLPLDPDYPAQRLELMIRDAEPALILTHSHLAPLLKGQSEVVCLEELRPALEDCSAANLCNLNCAEDLAYVIYTSGSTGTPKGTAVCHRGVVRLLFGQKYLDFGPTLVFLQLAPVGFDASTLEIWGPLLHGGRCVLYPGRVPELDLLGTLLRLEKINTLWLTASLFNVVVDEAPHILRTLRTVLTGGEALSVPHVRKAIELLTDTELINGYGPTESTTFTCCYRIPRPLPDHWTSIPIGSPIAHTHVYIANEQMQPVGVGAWGELYIGGDGLARGYLKRPEMTAERFIPNPFDGRAADGRLYRTGDICRRRDDDTLEFQGRTDDQVKIRGFRIELGEIEHALRTCPGVRQAAAAVRQDSTGQKFLAGYFVHEPGEPVSVDALRSRLAEQLPGYMVPAFLVRVDHMPLTANGKIDRTALPDPTGINAGGPVRTPAQTATEKALAQLWKEVLGLEQPVHRDDNFFELGGHSLKAIQIIYRTQELYTLDLEAAAIFQHPTLAEFAGAVDNALNTPETKPSAISRVARNNPIPLSYAQRRMWFMQQVSQDMPVYNVAWMITMQGTLNIGALEKSLAGIIHRHESFRTTVAVCSGEPMQIIHAPEPWSLAVEHTERTHDATEHVFGRLAEREAQTQFDLEKGPLFRFTLFDAGAGHYALTLTMHHLITDGWSMGLFMEELALLYRHFALNEPLELPELAVQYADFSCWQQATIETAKKTDFEYWKAKLADPISPCTIPEDHPRPLRATHRGQWEYRQPDPGLLGALTRLCRRHTVTLYTLLLCAYQILLSSVTGQEDIILGSPISGRTGPQTERIIGFFVNTVVMRTRVRHDLSFSEMLHITQRDCIEAQRHQNLPYDLLVEWLNPPRDPAYTLYFQTLLAYQDARYWSLTLPALDCQTIEIGTRTSKFDLILFAEENETGLCFRAEYNTDLYQPSTIQSFLCRYEHLLTSIAENPDQPISALCLPPEKPPLTAIDSRQESSLTAPSHISPNHRTLPLNPVEEGLARLWKELLGLHTVYREDNFFQLGGQSLKAASLFYRIKELFQISLPLSLIFETPTLEGLAAQIQRAEHDAITKDIVMIKAGSLKQALFCLPGAGGHTLNFYHFANQLDIPLAQYGLNLPGLDGARPMLRSIEEMAAYFLTLITAIQPSGPYFLCGFSMGGTIAYEIALQLKKRHQTVAFLAALGTPAPGLPRTYRNKLLYYAGHLYRFLRISLSEKKRYLRYRKEGREKLLLKRKNQLDFIQMDHYPFYKQMGKIGFDAFVVYRPKEHYSEPFILVRDVGNPHPLFYDLYSNPVFGWDRYVQGPITVYDVPCEHSAMLQELNVYPYAKLLEKEILTALDKTALR